MDGDLGWLVFSVGIIIGMALGVGIINTTWRHDMITRGYAEYCPLDGSFAFKGECK